MTTKNYRNIIIMIGLIIFGIWIGGWIVSDTKDFVTQPTGDVFNSIGALFGGLAFGGVILTIKMQLDELEETREELAKTAQANYTIANEAREKAILELYQTYCSERFQIIKTSSFNTIISAIQNKQYCEFMISRFFVISNKELTEEIAKKLPIYKKEYNISFDEFKAKEQFDRFRLDELINFFTLLANKESSKDVIKNCDFFYDWWRPLFWFISELQLEYYNTNKNIQMYSKEPYLRSVVLKLDEIYEHKPFQRSKDIWEYILKHPKIQSYNIDVKYNSYLL